MPDAFEEVDYAMLVKHYSTPQPEVQAARRYSPTAVTGITKEAITGDPSERFISTSHIECQS